MTTLHTIAKSSPFIKRLAADPEIPTAQEAIKIYQSGDEREQTVKFNTPRLLESGAFQYTVPTKRKNYKHLITSPAALETLGLDPQQPSDPEFQALVSGKEFIHTEDIFPYAQAYAGFQFGQFAGQLGDGRVVNLFQVRTDKNEKYDLQLKGAGKTAFSRFADGKAVLRSSIREFTISEALSGIGIPSTRALSLSSLPGTFAQREGAETCAVVLRFAPSWIRIGTFDYYRYKKDRDGLRKLSDYVIEDVLQNKLPAFESGKYKTDKYKDLTEDEEGKEADGETENETLVDITNSTKYEQMYREIVRLNARTVAYWQVYGFLNGVLNTDNTSILGLSIDFGPFSFLDKFDPDFTPNHDDGELRYSFANQPSIIWWNLTRLGESLIELIGAGPDLINDETFIKEGVKGESSAKEVISRASSIIKLASHEYKDVFMENYNSLFGKRIGLADFQESDNDLFAKLLEVLSHSKTDYNQFFISLQNEQDLTKREPFLTPELTQRFAKPEDKIDRERNEELGTLIDDWLKLYRERLESQNISYEERFKVASSANPLFVPRNWILDDVIEALRIDEDENVPILTKLLKMSSNPYDRSKWGEELKDLEEKWLNYDDNDKTMLQCSCSS
jgi:uncharacterized protein YdiU (UPF0061 family)